MHRCSCFFILYSFHVKVIERKSQQCSVSLRMLVYNVISVWVNEKPFVKDLRCTLIIMNEVYLRILQVYSGKSMESLHMNMGKLSFFLVCFSLNSLLRWLHAECRKKIQGFFSLVCVPETSRKIFILTFYMMYLPILWLTCQFFSSTDMTSAVLRWSICRLIISMDLMVDPRPPETHHDFFRYYYFTLSSLIPQQFHVCIFNTNLSSV